MLRAEDNKFLTESGAGTPMGELLRRFWLPVLLSEELPEPDGEPKKIIVMGEELLAFRPLYIFSYSVDLGLFSCLFQG
jgi:phthalate 4,5-dioxygenase